MALLWGLVAFACSPVAALPLLITIIAIPLALLAILLFVALLLAGQAMTAAASIAASTTSRIRSGAMNRER